jgi:acyl-CoA synthetase (AMP-forming)/AMP-acid ligase II
MHPGVHAREQPDARAVVIGASRVIVTFRELEERSNRLAQLFRSRGLEAGAHLAVLLENSPEYFEVVWAGLRAGLYVTPINWHLGPEEAGYIIEDCGADALVTSSAFAQLVGQLEPYLGKVRISLAIGDGVAGCEAYENAVAGQPPEPIADESEGAYMFYSSGTTGRPKGIKPPLLGLPFGSGSMLEPMLTHLYGVDDTAVYLCPAPLYHAAPIGWSIAVQRLGGTVVVMERFDAEDALALIERERVTHAQFVPTHFVRMLKLPADVRAKYDVSSLRTVVHAAAPCPVEVKQQMLDWLGPKIYEYYSGSEGSGFCAIGPDEWMAHPGSVGRPVLGTVHIVGEDGIELPAGDIGQIWFESPAQFEYHNDPAKTAEAFDEHGWSTLGDVGYVDADGYVYLTDRVSHMIISGGVNIYPQEIENALVLHPAVTDVAVIGVPDAEMGESVKAVVQLADPSAASDELANELIGYCRARLAGFKCPRSVDFVDELPRLPTGKLLKRVLRERYDKGA